MPRATDHIPEMVALILILEEKGYTYRKDGSVYFNIARFDGYGKLSKTDFSGAQAGASVDTDKYDKANARDFVLWKARKEGEDFWETELGPGRPGWHIECSAMSMKYLGETFDIHCGGIDLVFPHHENEIAQSECATGRPFARYWVHPEFLIVEGEKMSKSLGNFLTLRDLTAQGYAPEAIRYLLLSVHYRKQLNFTMDGLHQAAAAIDRLEDFLLRAREKASDEAPTPEFKAEAAAARVRFREAMDSDINTSAALAALFDFVRAANQRDSRGALTGGDARLAIAFLEEVDGVFNILRGRPEILDEEIARQIEARQEARRRRISPRPTASATSSWPRDPARGHPRRGPLEAQRGRATGEITGARRKQSPHDRAAPSPGAAGGTPGLPLPRALGLRHPGPPPPHPLGRNRPGRLRGGHPRVRGGEDAHRQELRRAVGVRRLGKAPGPAARGRGFYRPLRPGPLRLPLRRRLGHRPGDPALPGRLLIPAPPRPQIFLTRGWIFPVLW